MKTCLQGWTVWSRLTCIPYLSAWGQILLLLLVQLSANIKGTENGEQREQITIHQPQFPNQLQKHKKSVLIQDFLYHIVSMYVSMMHF